MEVYSNMSLPLIVSTYIRNLKLVHRYIRVDTIGDSYVVYYLDGMNKERTTTFKIKSKLRIPLPKQVGIVMKDRKKYSRKSKDTIGD